MTDKLSIIITRDHHDDWRKVWQYVGCTWINMHSWLEDNYNAKITNAKNGLKITFSDQSDMMMFQLKWIR